MKLFLIVVEYPKKHHIILCCLALSFLVSCNQIISSTFLSITPLQLQYNTLVPNEDIYKGHHRNSCANTIGNDGHWIQDWTYARDYGQYSEPRPILAKPYEQRTWAKFRSSDEAPFNWPSSFRWIDSNSKGCQINHTIIPSCNQTCDLLHTLNIDRILFYGDSMTLAQYTSFVNFLGYKCIRQIENKPAPPQHQVELVCPHSIVGIRLSRGEAGEDPNPPTQEYPRVNITLSNETRDFIQYPYNNNLSFNNKSPSMLSTKKTGKRLVTIFNLGTHYHTFPGFKNDMDILLDWIEDFAHPNDLVFFRPTPSGHTQCYPGKKIHTSQFIRGLKVYPFDSLAEFIPTETYFWHMLPQFNQYVTNKIRRERQERTVPIRILNVVNMTLLRRDGHIGPHDCLHYILPGPPDWWNHLLMTELLEVAKDKEEGKNISG